MNNMLLAKRLRELRTSYGYDQELVASHLDISRQAYSHYETGRNKPPTKNLYKLAELYEIPVEDFLQLLSASMIENYENHEPLNDTTNMLSNFLDYLAKPSNEKKLKPLTRREKELLYYFEMLSFKDQEDILAFMKIKAQSRKK